MHLQTGEKFDIFQDRKNIAWGQQWRQRINESLDAVTFLIPIITPGFFTSTECRAELEKFLEREKQLARNDLILPIYYFNCPILNDEAKREADPLAKAIGDRQFADWRDLRFEPLTSPQVGKMLARLATQVVEALGREKPPPRPASTAATPTTAPKDAKQDAAAVGSLDEIAARGPTYKTEPATHVVDAMNRGDYSNLTGALKAANPGDRILVRPGLYREGIVIDKPVEIIGDGRLDEVVVEASGSDVVLFQASMGRIANLTLRQVGSAWSCIDIAQGRLDVEGCDISSRGLACVAIHSGADPRLRRNRIHDGKQGGVFVYEDGQGTLEDNEIFSNAFAGVTISKGSNPTLRRNRIHDGKQGGVFVYEDGQGTLEDNEIFSNAHAGVLISKGGNPTLRRNRISQNGHQAIRVYANGQGLFEDNDLRDNKLGAWDVSPGSQDKMTRTRNQE